MKIKLKTILVCEHNINFLFFVVSGYYILTVLHEFITVIKILEIKIKFIILFNVSRFHCYLCLY